jgi:hypothetical protein
MANRIQSLVRYIAKIGFILFLIGSCIVSAADNCTLPNIASVMTDERVPIKLKYQLIEGSDKNLTPVIYLQGGPAELIMGDTPAIDSKITFVQMDLRGTVAMSNPVQLRTFLYRQKYLPRIGYLSLNT